MRPMSISLVLCQCVILRSGLTKITMNMNSLKMNIVLFDLRKYSSPEELARIARRHNLSDDVDKLSELSSKYSRVYFDQINGDMVAVQFKGDKGLSMTQFCEDRLFEIKCLPPIHIENIELNIDDILDKISVKGVKSINDVDKLLLENI
jgi:hypothetical protein